jgi:hypothetical protein
MSGTSSHAMGAAAAPTNKAAAARILANSFMCSKDVFNLAVAN